MDDNGNFVDTKIQEELSRMAHSDEQKALFQKAVVKCKEQGIQFCSTQHVINNSSVLNHKVF